MVDAPLVLAFMELLTLSDFPAWFRLSLQFIILWASLLLLLYMVRYESKSFLDVSLLLRELAFAILIIRLIVLNSFTLSNPTLTNASYLFLAISCVLVVYSVVRARSILHYKRHHVELMSDEEGNINEEV